MSSPVPVGSPPHRPRAHSNDTNQPTAPATQPLLPPPLHAHSRYSDLSCSSLSLPTHRAALGHRAASATPPPAILALHMHPLLLTPPPLRYLLTPPPPPPPPASSFAARLLLRRPPPPSPPWRVLYAWTAHYTRHDAPEAPEGSRHHLAPSSLHCLSAPHRRRPSPHTAACQRNASSQSTRHKRPPGRHTRPQGEASRALHAPLGCPRRLCPAPLVPAPPALLLMSPALLMSATGDLPPNCPLAPICPLAPSPPPSQPAASQPAASSGATAAASAGGGTQPVGGLSWAAPSRRASD